MKQMPTQKKKNTWNMTVVLFGIIHSIVALIIYELLWFQPCTDGLFLGACEIGRRMGIFTMISAWCVFSLVFSVLFVQTNIASGSMRRIVISYFVAGLTTIGFLGFLYGSGLLLLLSTL